MIAKKMTGILLVTAAAFSLAACDDSREVKSGTKTVTETETTRKVEAPRADTPAVVAPAPMTPSDTTGTAVPVAPGSTTGTTESKTTTTESK